MGIKSQNGRNNSGNKTILGKVNYKPSDQKELSYFIESIETIGSSMIPGPQEDGLKFQFPGFIWTVLMSR